MPERIIPYSQLNVQDYALGQVQDRVSKTFDSIGRAITELQAGSQNQTATQNSRLGGFGMLTKTSASSLAIVRNGNGSTIPVKQAGVWVDYPIPIAGASATNSGLSVNTQYYVYAYDNLESLALEISATGYIADSITGVQVKKGDPTRTLVGAVLTDATGSALWSTSTQISSWFGTYDQIFPIDPWHTIGATGEPAFQNGWSAYPGSPPQYPGFPPQFRKYGHQVFLQGIVQTVGANSISTTFFTLPIGYRPSANLINKTYPTETVTTGTVGLISIDSTGAVKCYYGPVTAGAYFRIDISFLADN